MAYSVSMVYLPIPIFNPIWFRGITLRADLGCTSAKQADIILRRWCIHGSDVRPLAVDSVRRQYQAELVFVVGFGCYYGRY